jgi:hypothetical protein
MMVGFWTVLLMVLWTMNPHQIEAAERLRLLVETDAGGDPDDEQSLVRFLLYTCEWDVEGIIANRPFARDGENQNPERTGLGIVRRLVNAYGKCWTNLVRHVSRYPSKEYLWDRTVPGYGQADEAVKLIIRTVDSPDPRPLWYSDWGTDSGAATNNMKRALDQVLRERGPEGYAKFKSKLRLASHDKFGDHTTGIAPPFALWVNTFEPPIEAKRWYHRFSTITATAGGFNLARDVLTEHGPLGALYPTNTTHRQKEGDTMTFLYLVPTGMNDPLQPTWGSWAGRYGPHENFPSKSYFWANQADGWNGSTNRDNTLARWAVALQNDFRARLDWCVKPRNQANHPPVVKVDGPLRRTVSPGLRVSLSAVGSSDPDGQALSYWWEIYPEAGTYTGVARINNADKQQATVELPRTPATGTLHVILSVTDNGTPALTRYQRVLLEVR